MRRLTLAAALLVMPGALPVTHASATPVANWPAVLASFLSSPDVLTNDTLAAAISPAIRLDHAGCQTARLPGPASDAPVSTSVIAYDDDQACNRPTRLVLLEFSLAATTEVLSRFREALAAVLPAPCFSGDLTPGGRRRVPPRHLTAWKLPGRIVTIATEAGDPGDMSVALLQTGQSATVPADKPSARVTQDFIAALPTGCR